MVGSVARVTHLERECYCNGDDIRSSISSVTRAAGLLSCQTLSAARLRALAAVRLRVLVWRSPTARGGGQMVGFGATLSRRPAKPNVPLQAGKLCDELSKARKEAQEAKRDAHAARQEKLVAQQHDAAIMKARHTPKETRTEERGVARQFAPRFVARALPPSDSHAAYNMCRSRCRRAGRRLSRARARSSGSDPRRRDLAAVGGERSAALQSEGRRLRCARGAAGVVDRPDGGRGGGGRRSRRAPQRRRPEAREGRRARRQRADRRGS